MKKGDGKMYQGTAVKEPFFVRVMAVDGIWAMVRRPGRIPFVAHVGKLNCLPRGMKTPNSIDQYYTQGRLRREHGNSSAPSLFGHYWLGRWRDCWLGVKCRWASLMTGLRL